MSNELFTCERCGSNNDVAMIYVNDVPVTYCRECRVALFTKKNPVGRPSLGETKKVSLTLPEAEWKELDEKANGNRSQFIRRAVITALDHDTLPSNQIYFKDEVHHAQTKKLLTKFRKKNITDDLEYGALSYVVGATYKADYLLQVIDEENTIDLDILYENMKVLSHTEQSMIKFALQLFNHSVNDIKLSDVMRSLDSDNTKVIKQAIEIRF